MAVKNQGKSHGRVSRSSALKTARRNLERAIRAYDQRGEKGLQAEFDRIFSGTKNEPPEILNQIHIHWMPKGAPPVPVAPKAKTKAAKPNSFGAPRS
jgi:hypothetical protein